MTKIYWRQYVNLRTMTRLLFAGAVILLFVFSYFYFTGSGRKYIAANSSAGSSFTKEP